MAFQIIQDGDYSTPVLLGRLPVRDTGFQSFNHFIWQETHIVEKASYYPLAPGVAHPDAKEDPYDVAAESFAGEIFDLTSGGAGQPLYLIEEQILGYVGNLCLFRRDYSALPPAWTETEHGYYTFPGLRYFNAIYRKPQNLPVLLEHQYDYVLGNLETLSAYDTTPYQVVYGVDGETKYVNWIEYYGRFVDDEGTYTTQESKPAYKTGDEKAGGIPWDITDTPSVEVVVSRWKGEIFQVKRTVVKYKQ